MGEANEPKKTALAQASGLWSGLASCHWEAALTAREASQRKQAGQWQNLTPAVDTAVDGVSSLVYPAIEGPDPRHLDTRLLSAYKALAAERALVQPV